jgi:hypothetical protein
VTTLTDLTPDQCEQIFHAALSAGDPRGVEAALTLLAARDPQRAQSLLNIARFAVAVAATGQTTEEQARG